MNFDGLDGAGFDFRGFDHSLDEDDGFQLHPCPNPLTTQSAPIPHHLPFTSPPRHIQPKNTAHRNPRHPLDHLLTNNPLPTLPLTLLLTLHHNPLHSQRLLPQCDERHLCSLGAGVVHAGAEGDALAGVGDFVGGGEEGGEFEAGDV